MASFQRRKPKTWKITILNQSNPAERSFGKLDSEQHETRRGLQLTKSTTCSQNHRQPGYAWMLFPAFSKRYLWITPIANYFLHCLSKPMKCEKSITLANFDDWIDNPCYQSYSLKAGFHMVATITMIVQNVFSDRRDPVVFISLRSYGNHILTIAAHLNRVITQDVFGLENTVIWTRRS